MYITNYKPSSREINSFEKVKPGIRPLFLSQKIEQNEPEKNTPSTIANATSLSAKESELFIHLRAHSAFFFILGIVSIALNKRAFSVASLINVSINNEYVSE